MTRTRTNNLTRYPVSSNGGLLHYPIDRSEWDPDAKKYRPIPQVYVPNEPFHATLRLDSMASGRSAKYVIWRAAVETDGRRWPMFVVDLLELAQFAIIDHGVVSARWQVRKRGQNYGIALAPGGEA